MPLARTVRFLVGPGRLITIGLVIVAAFAAGFVALWNYVGPHVLSSDSYLLDADDIHITETPPWVRADVKREVLRDASLDGRLSIFDPADGRLPLTERLAEAFRLHPWVKEVVRVEKHHPARVDVQLEYRRPVCMVEVPGGLYPVDAEGVVLPTGDFLVNKYAKIEALRYPRVASIETLPMGPIGSPWGDDRVHGAARLGAVLLDDWESLKLARIVPTESSLSVEDAGPQFVVFTDGCTRIIWGHAPGSETPSEVPADEKLARLKRHAEQHGSLDEPPGISELDLRPWREPTVRTTTAEKP